jgi:hypothetical protein
VYSLVSSLMTPLHTRQAVKKDMFSESCSQVWIQLRCVSATYFPHRLRPPEAHLTLNGQNIPFVNHVKYLGVIFDKRVTWGLHTGMIEAKTFR